MLRILFSALWETVDVSILFNQGAMLIIIYELFHNRYLYRIIPNVLIYIIKIR